LIRLASTAKEQNKKMNKLKHDAMLNECKGCRKTKISPSRAEQHAFVEQASILLMDKDRKSLKTANLFLLQKF